MNLEALTAADLMSSRIHEAHPEMTLREAAARMDEHGIHCLMVRPSSALRGLGVISCKDVIDALASGDVALLDEVRVEEAMSVPAISVQDDLCIADCLRLMTMAGVRSVPVLSGKDLVGVLSFTDVMHRAAQER